MPWGIPECAASRAGDMPVALMFDGPSLGGFVCPATITSTELWKMGQVSAKDTVHFKPITLGTPTHSLKTHHLNIFSHQSCRSSLQR